MNVYLSTDDYLRQTVYPVSKSASSSVSEDLNIPAITPEKYDTFLNIILFPRTIRMLYCTYAVVHIVLFRLFFTNLIFILLHFVQA